VRESGEILLAVRHGVPRSTARGWVGRTRKSVVTFDLLGASAAELRRTNILLRRRIEKLRAVLAIVFAVLGLSNFCLSNCRRVDAAKRMRLLRALERARRVFPRRAALRLLGVSPAGYHAWRRTQDGCDLEVRPRCPKISPHQLTHDEIQTIRELVTSVELRHVPTGTLSVFAQRLGRVFASASTWYRLVRENGWRRPRLRVYPAKPKVGLRASRPNELWHADATVIRLLDNTKAYVHAVIDNFSRRILAWRVSTRLERGNTVAVLLEAASGVTDMPSAQPTVVTDSGVENVNDTVDHLIESGRLRRLLAMTEITGSNSMIEAWWRTLKHQWLYLTPLDSLAAIERLVAFYVTEHNSRLPHSALSGETPDERYFGTGEHVARQLEAARAAARNARLEANRAAACGVCEGQREIASRT
jgi:putative transposase